MTDHLIPRSLFLSRWFTLLISSRNRISIGPCLYLCLGVAISKLEADFLIINMSAVGNVFTISDALCSIDLFVRGFRGL